MSEGDDIRAEAVLAVREVVVDLGDCDMVELWRLVRDEEGRGGDPCGVLAGT